MIEPNPNLERFGLRLPPDLPPLNTGDAKLDAAILQVEKKAQSVAKRSSYEAIKLPARLDKPKPGDLEKVLTIFTPELFDVGESTFDMTRSQEPHGIPGRLAIVHPAQGNPAELHLWAGVLRPARPRRRSGHS